MYASKHEYLIQKQILFKIINNKKFVSICVSNLYNLDKDRKGLTLNERAKLLLHISTNISPFLLKIRIKESNFYYQNKDFNIFSFPSAKIKFLRGTASQKKKKKKKNKLHFVEPLVIPRGNSIFHINTRTPLFLYLLIFFFPPPSIYREDENRVTAWSLPFIDPLALDRSQWAIQIQSCITCNNAQFVVAVRSFVFDLFLPFNKIETKDIYIYISFERLYCQLQRIQTPDFHPPISQDLSA